MEHEQQTERIARLVRADLPNFRGAAHLYELTPPLVDRDWHDDQPRKTWQFVIASAAEVIGDPECYLFGADKDGEVIDWCELPGSMKGTLNHEEVLRNAGYRLEAA